MLMSRETRTGMFFVLSGLVVGGIGCTAGESTDSVTGASSSTGPSSTGAGGVGGTSDIGSTGAGGAGGISGTGGTSNAGGMGGGGDAECGNGIVEAGEDCDQGAANADDAMCTTACKAALCGDGLVLFGVEQCDDGNVDNSDACTILCKQPACDDGLHSGDEGDVDCGGSCGAVCTQGQTCNSAVDCSTPACIGGICEHASSCAELLQWSPGLGSGIYTIDPDGSGSIEPFDAHCDMILDGGGWTLVMVSSDDGTNTWTWVNRALMTTDQTFVGDINELNKDYKSQALHTVPFSDLLFTHAPSGVWAAYGDVGSGGTSIADWMAAIAYPVCDAALAGNGHPITAGTLAKGGNLCDTDLYFHLGDFDGPLNGVNYCMDLNSSYNDATYGPAWSTGNANGCPFDDPSGASFGPSNKCGAPECAGNGLTEDGRGFGVPLGLNTGAKGAAQNYIWMLVR